VSAEKDALEEKRADKIAEALKARGVTVSVMRVRNASEDRFDVSTIDASGKRRGATGRVKKGETAASLKRRLLWVIAIDVEHDATGCACTGGNCPAGAALHRRLSGMELPR
jgi:hypothetical protein